MGITIGFCFFRMLKHLAERMSYEIQVNFVQLTA